MKNENEQVNISVTDTDEPSMIGDYVVCQTITIQRLFMTLGS